MILKNYAYLFIFSVFFLFQSCRTETASSTKKGVSEVPELIRARLRAEPDGLMPFNTSKGFSLQVARLVFPMLIDINKITHKINPVLCKAIPEDIPITEGPFAGGSKLTFEIRDEAVWDDGSPVTGKDYAFTMKTIFNPKAKGLFRFYKAVYSTVKRIEVDEKNPKIFSVYCKESNFKLAENVGGWVLPAYHYDPEGLLTDIDVNILLDDEKAKGLTAEFEKLEKFGEQIVSPKYCLQAENIVSCGAYSVSEWTPSERIVITKKENWWGDNLFKEVPMLTAYPKAISYVFVPDHNAAIAMLKNEELDVLGMMEANSFSELRKNEMVASKYDLITPRTDNVNYIGLNNTNVKLSDVKVRKALSYLVDREKIASVVYDGYAKPVYSVIPVESEFYVADETVFNVDKAIALLEEAGWKDNDGNGVREKRINGKVIPLTLNVLSSANNVISQGMVRIFAESCKKAGVEITNTQMETRAMFATRNKGEYEMVAGAMQAPPGYYDPSQYWRTDSAANVFKTGSAEMDEVIDAITTNTDPTKFKALYVKFQTLMAEMQPVLFMVNSQERMAIKKGYNETLISSMNPGYHLAYFR